MATHTKVIELFGLPGCGKSTLSHSFLDNSKDDIQSFCGMNIISAEYREISFFKKMKFFPYKASLVLLLLIFKSGFSISNLKIYKSFLSIIMIYEFCKHLHKYNYMIIDHGVIQSIISLFYGSSIDRYENSHDVIIQLINIIDIDNPIYCCLSVDEAIKRMRMRNRIDSGRLDSIRDDKELKKVMTIQENQFRCIAHHFNIKSIEMESSIMKCRSDLLKLIS